ncbi:CopD family protein [Pelagibacterium montanilacus]|uniref:CopD family protein n=1 Tax=Pelagibacterium montanilacus TaxID=2185280 RepID=UPI001FE3BEB7|nr:CopD family protein [Pelagibacterium montanilacus]
MIVTVLKIAHITAISVWAAGLICMPFLFRQRIDQIEDRDLHRMHAMVRFLHIVIVSPAAFVAVGTGTALIFFQQTFDAWFTIKLFLVGLLAIIHVLTGLVILKLFKEAGRYPKWRYLMVTGMTTVVVACILVVVSAKPRIDAMDFAGEIFVPGALGTMLDPLIRQVIP